MHNLCWNKIDTDLHTGLLQSFQDMVLDPVQFTLQYQVSPTSGSTRMKATLTFQDSFRP